MTTSKKYNTLTNLTLNADLMHPFVVAPAQTIFVSAARENTRSLRSNRTSRVWHTFHDTYRQILRGPVCSLARSLGALLESFALP